jgi:hypothetical protein
MRKELEQQFATRWPAWFRDLYGDVTETCLHFGFQHRDGWFDLVWRLCEQIEKVVGEGTPFKVAQVKEKFGGLRFYFEGGNDAIGAIRACVGAAAQESFHICEVCGQPGYLIGHNRTRCDEHFHSGSSVEWDERYQNLLETDESAREAAAREFAIVAALRNRSELIPTELVTHACGHDKTYSRPSAEALEFVAEYARTTLCWDCWKMARARGER